MVFCVCVVVGFYVANLSMILSYYNFVFFTIDRERLIFFSWFFIQRMYFEMIFGIQHYVYFFLLNLNEQIQRNWCTIQRRKISTYIEYGTKSSVAIKQHQLAKLQQQRCK